MKMIKHIGNILILCMLGLYLMGEKTEVKAETIIKPDTLLSGTEEEQLKVESYTFSSDGNELFPFFVSEKSAVVVEMETENSGFITMEIYKKEDAGDMPEYWTCKCTAELQNTSTSSKYFEKGTYYIRFPKNRYKVRFFSYSNENKTINQNTVIVGYANYRKNVYYTYKPTKDGYVTIQSKNLYHTPFSTNITLCDSKGKEISDSLKNYELNDQSIFAVKKNKVYQFRVSFNDINGERFYQLSFQFKEQKDQGGEKKKKAFVVKYNKVAAGNIYAEDKVGKEHWYKITNSKNRKVLLSYSGCISSGSLLFDFYDSKGKKLVSKTIITPTGENGQCQVYTRNSGYKLLKGTYYVRVRKTCDTATGIYSFKLSNYVE